MPSPPVLHHFTPVPAVFAPSQQRGHEIAVYIFPHNHSLCYEFFFHCLSADHVTQTYLCCGCKALRTRDNQKYRQPIPSCKLRNGCFITDPLNPIRPHFCFPRSTPQATTRRLIIERCNELRAGPCEKPTKNVVEDILSDITSSKFDAFPIGERRVMVEQIASPYGNARENLRRTLQRNQQRGLNPSLPRPKLTGKTRKQLMRNRCLSSKYENPQSSEDSSHSNEDSVVSVIPRKKFVCIEPTRTLVFMDLAATHVFTSREDVMRSPEISSGATLSVDTFEKLILETQPSEYPRITEMSFLSLPRDVFTRGQKTIKSLVHEAPDQAFVLRLSANVHTCQLNPELNDQEWDALQDISANDIPIVPRPRCDLVLKRTFAEEWPSIRSFLDECPKPVCLVAHNGILFDYRVLYGELFRCGFIGKDMGMPKGVLFVDSVLAIQEIEDIFCREIYNATKELTSQRVIYNVESYENVACNDVSNAKPCSDISSHGVALISDSMQSSRISLKKSLQQPTSTLFPSECVTLQTNILKNCDIHPLSVINAGDWPPAKLRRIRPEFFMRNKIGVWEFNLTVAKNGLKSDLAVLYETVVKTPYEAHFSQEGAEALLQVCLAYGKEFQDYVDYRAAHFPF